MYMPTPALVTSIIIGANRGIGLELCKQLHARGDHVIAVCRRPSAALSNLGVNRIIDSVDVGSAEQVKNMAYSLEGVKIDNLWCNSGIMVEDNLDSLSLDDDFEGIRESFEINSLGPLRVVKALLPNLKSGSKILLMTSRMGSIDDNTSGEYYGYRASKTALNAIGKSLSLDLKSKKISVAILHPGFVKTDMTKQYWSDGIIEPSESARGLIARADGLMLAKTGTFYHMNGEELPW